MLKPGESITIAVALKVVQSADKCTDHVEGPPGISLVECPVVD